MTTTCRVYLSDGIPMEVNNAHYVLYFPDGSAHIFDKNDRPVFIAAPGRFSAVSIDYAVNEEPEARQVPNVARRPQNPQRPSGGANIPVQPVRERKEAPAEKPEPPQETTGPVWQRMDRPSHPFPSAPSPGISQPRQDVAGESQKVPEMHTGEVRIAPQTLHNRGDEAGGQGVDDTQPFRAVQEVPSQDFSQASPNARHPQGQQRATH